MDLASDRRVGTERVDLVDAFDRILAEDIVSDIDIPPFTQSTRDGFACRRVDLGNELKVVETIAAGEVPQSILGPNECARIMTGAAIPRRADCVVMLEHAEELGENGVRCTPRGLEDNICLQGANVTAGKTVLHAGERIKAQQVAVLATVGCSQPLVSRRPKVGVIATGGELVAPDRKPEACQIRNSNSFQLSAMALGASAMPQNYGLVGDEKEAIQAVLTRAMAENDVVVLSGGIWKGDYDFVRDVLAETLVDLVFDRVRLNSGRLMVFGVSQSAFCFGLSGNPVSNFIMFELVVKPFLYGIAGHTFKATVTHAQMAKTVVRDEGKKDLWLPVSLAEDGRAHPIECRGSMSIMSLCRADGLTHVPAGVTEVRQGTTVVVRQI